MKKAFIGRRLEGPRWDNATSGVENVSIPRLARPIAATGTFRESGRVD